MIRIVSLASNTWSNAGLLISQIGTGGRKLLERAGRSDRGARAGLVALIACARRR
jgi:hypothetical protein